MLKQVILKVFGDNFIKKFLITLTSKTLKTTEDTHTKFKLNVAQKFH